MFEEPANTEEEPLPPPPPPPPAEDTLPPPPPEAELPVENLAIDDAIDIPPPTSPTTRKVADQSTVSDMKDEDKDSGTEEQPESVKSNESDIRLMCEELRFKCQCKVPVAYDRVCSFWWKTHAVPSH